MKYVLDIEHFLMGKSSKFSDLLGMADGIMLTGSYATKSALNCSDIDIIIISRSVNYLYSESICYKKEHIHLIFFPFYKFQDIIIQDINTGRGIYISMIRKGLVIKDTKFNILTKTKRFVLNTIDGIRSEQRDFELLHKITSNIDIIKNSSSLIDKIYCASELLLEVSRLITCAYIADAKHLSRITTTQSPELTLINSYQQFIITKDHSNYIKDIEAILVKYGGLQYAWTSSWVFTYPYDRHIMVFFPMHYGNELYIRRYIKAFSSITHDCYYYGFYIGKNQIMEEGYYLFIYSSKRAIETIHEELENNKKLILRESNSKLQISFPYKSLFYKGLQFGGTMLFMRLLPCFARIWRTYFELQNKQTDSIHNNTAHIIATYYFYQFYDSLDFLDIEISHLLSEMCDLLVLEAVDPNGLYNAMQMEYMKKKILYKYQHAYQKHRVAYKEIITSFNDDSLRELYDFKLIFHELFEILRNTADNDILYPDIYTVKDKKRILVYYISLHIMSIFQLSPQEQFGILFNLLQYNRYDIQ